MHSDYLGVTSRFLNDDERMVLSDEKEMPLVLEAKEEKSQAFLQHFLKTHSQAIKKDMARYGAVLLRGFLVNSDEDFEKTVLSIDGFEGISDAFMSENGRTHVGDLRYVLHTNSVYKTGGTLYLGGFHTENYYSADVPGFLCFYCAKPSTKGGETGLVNAEKLYYTLNPALQKKLEKHPYFVSQWLLSEVASRYEIPAQQALQTCTAFGLPIHGEGEKQFIAMYKPSVLKHPLTQKKALQLNLFELPTLNYELRQCFMNDYPGRDWFWHRLMWRLPTPVFNAVEQLAVALIAFVHSPKKAWHILCNKWSAYQAQKKEPPSFESLKVGSCFNQEEVKALAKAMRQYYSSCLWQQGDVLLIDNRKVMHAGMPGVGPRQIRALIANPLKMPYEVQDSGCIEGVESHRPTLGERLATTHKG